jgi:hypothetical protein
MSGLYRFGFRQVLMNYHVFTLIMIVFFSKYSINVGTVMFVYTVFCRTKGTQN